MLYLREFGVVDFGDCCIGIGPKSLPIIGWYVVYSVVMQSWVVGSIFSSPNVLISVMKWC